MHDLDELSAVFIEALVDNGPGFRSTDIGSGIPLKEDAVELDGVIADGIGHLCIEKAYGLSLCRKREFRLRACGDSTLGLEYLIRNKELLTGREVGAAA